MTFPARPSFPWLTVGGLGRLRPAPGTWGSIPPVAVAWALVLAGHGPGQSPWVYNGVLVLLGLAFTIACVVQGDHAEAVLGKDPSNVVADEVAGQSLTLLALPTATLGTPLSTMMTLAAAFLVFRLMDIVKPWPARQIQNIPGGWGIVLDDLFAGLYALAVVQVACRTLG